MVRPSLAAASRHAAVLAVYLGLAGLLFAGVFWAPAERLIGVTGGDSIQFVWFLRWPSFALSHGLNPLFTTYVNFPDGANLMWNASISLPSTLLSPITLWLGPVFAYNLLVTLAVALSAWTGYLAIRRYVPHTVAAWGGGLLYGFSPYMMAHALGHPHVLIALVPPLILIVLDEVIVRQQRSAVWMGAALGALAAVQLLIGEELLASSALVAALGVLLLADLNPQRVRAHAGHAIRALGVAAAVFVVLAAYPLALQFFGPEHPPGALQTQNEYVTDVLNFLVPTSLQQVDALWTAVTSWGFTGNLTEQTGYLGIPLLLLLAFTAVHFWEERFVRFAALLGGLVALLSLGPMLHIGGIATVVPAAVLALPAPALKRYLPFRPWLVGLIGLPVLLVAAPVLDNILPARLMLYAYLMAAFLLARFVQWGLRLTIARERLVAAAALALTFASLFPRVPYPTASPIVPSFFRAASLQELPQGAVILVAPFSRAGHATAMFWQAASGMRFRMPEGYVFVAHHANLADPPASATLDALTGIEEGLVPTRTEGLRQLLLGDLHRWHVRQVVVGPMAHEDRAVDLYTWVLGTTPAEVGGVFSWSMPTA